jgi:E3 ubiquitin-protein ligase HUWE1
LIKIQHLIKLLQCSDAELVEKTLFLLVRPAQRLSRVRGSKSGLSAAQEYVLNMAQGWGSKENGLDLVQIGRDDDVASSFSSEAYSFVFQFYRESSAPAKASDLNSSSKSSSTGLEQIQPVTSTSTPVKAFKHTPFTTPVSASSGELFPLEKSSSGLVNIHIPDIRQSGKSVKELVLALIEQYQIPEEYHFRIFHRLRVSFGLSDPKSRNTLIRIRILAICIARML